MKHRHTYFSALMIWCVAFFANAQVDLKPKFYSFGNVKPGKAYQLKVKISNTTNQTISLWNLRTDCDCSTAHINQAVLKPKTSTWMTIDYHPALGEDGFKNLSVSFTVYTKDIKNALQRTYEKFLYTSKVSSPYVFQPSPLEGSLVLTGHSTQSHGLLKLDTKDYPGWHPDPTVVVTPQPFTAQIKPLPTPGIFDVILTTSEKTPPGSYSGTIQFTGKSIGKGKTTELFQYPFKTTVGSIWFTSPAILDLGVLDPVNFKDWKKSTVIREIFRKPFKILKVEGLPVWLEYEIGKSPVGDLQIRWKIKEDDLKKNKDKNFPENLVIKTDSKEETEIDIPLRASWLVPTPVPTKVPAPQLTATQTPVATVKPTPQK